MNAPHSISDITTRIGQKAARAVRAGYRIAIKPRQTDEDARRREFILNVILATILVVTCVLEISIIYADATGMAKDGFTSVGFSVFIAFFAALLTLSRGGHPDLASYMFVGLFYLATTYGVWIWGTALPLSILSYAAVIIASSILIGTRGGFAMIFVTIGTVMTLGWLQTRGLMSSDISWRALPVRFKDTIEDSVLYLAIGAISWLSNRELERSLARAKRSERALAVERDSLEVKVEARTRELRQAQLDKVNQLYRFAEFGRLSSGIFHDLANPLSVLSLSVERLKSDNCEAYATVQDHIDKAVKASRRIETFMATVRKQLASGDEKREFSMNDEVEDAIDLLAHKSKTRGVSVEFSASERVVIIGNPVKFFQIVVNLISNAIDAYAGVEDKEPISVSVSSGDATATLSVRDCGCGIDESAMRSIFDPFYTTKSQADGTGLGLSTTKQIVEDNFGGSIRVDSRPGVGSTFTATIPIDNVRNPTEADRGIAPRNGGALA